MEPGQHGSKADVLPWKLAPPFPLLLMLLLLRSTGRVCCSGKREMIGWKDKANTSRSLNVSSFEIQPHHRIHCISF